MKIFIIGSNSFMGTSLLSYFINDLKDKNVEIFACSRSSENHSYQINNIKNKYKFYKIDLNKNVAKYTSDLQASLIIAAVLFEMPAGLITATDTLSPNTDKAS